MATTKNNQAREADREILIVRTIDAPCNLVWQAWTDPDRIGAWWGPDGFTTTTHQFELKPGGTWRFVMHGPDGTDFLNRIAFREVSEPNRLVYDQDNEAKTDDEAIRFQTRVSFEAQEENRTKVTLHTVFERTEVRDHVSKTFGAVEGGIECLGRLAQYVIAGADGSTRKHREVMTMALPHSREIVLHRRFHAPPSLVFDMFTKAEHLRNWWGCGAFEIESCETDLRVGGQWRVVMRTPEGSEIPAFGTYLEIVNPRRVVQSVHLFREDDPNDPPIETLEFRELEGGQKTLLVNSVRYPTQADRDRHMQSGIDQGAASAFDMIDEMLRKPSTA